MFGIKKCRSCRKELKKDWIVCPYCGESIREVVKIQVPYDIFENIEKDIKKEFERIDKLSGLRFFKFPKIDIQPFGGTGVNIIIKTNTGMKPKVNVKTFGGYKKLEPEIKRRFGVKESVEKVEEYKPERKPPKITEEPETKIETFDNEETINIKLPDVKSADDIEIRKLEQSLEVKAFADDKAYFKLVPIKPHSQISEKSFKNGVLKIALVV
jgi:HSP20 family molecular chaperone IbpA